MPPYCSAAGSVWLDQVLPESLVPIKTALAEEFWPLA
jgi:hypothetical protein